MKLPSCALFIAVSVASALALDPKSTNPELRGLIANDKGGQRFYLSISGSGQGEWLSLGDTFFGWKLVAYRTSGALLVLRRNDGAELDLSLTPSHINTSTIGDALPKERATLVLVDTPLADAIVEFNRQNRMQLVLGDTNVGRLRLNGKVHPGEVDAFVRLLKKALGVKVEYLDKLKMIVLRNGDS